MTSYETLKGEISAARRRWVVTGGAGFIGSHLVEALLGLGQHVVVLDDFSTGHAANLDAVVSTAGEDASKRLAVVRGDIREPQVCAETFRGADVVLHEAARGSVPRSIEHPIATHEVNVTGFLNVLEAARSCGVRRLVYASSSSVYGDHPDLPKREDAIGSALSPYAASKRCNEVYAAAYARCYGLELVGLRYFNVFGPRQDPQGPYAAVVPRWFGALLAAREVSIFGDGETSRDFCYVANVVQANLLAATTARADALGKVYNVAFGGRTTLNQLFELVRGQVARYRPAAAAARPVYRDFRPGDVRHSLADVSRAMELLGYRPTHSVDGGLCEAAAWYASAATARSDRVQP
jgi:UDP-N-acetylglucosamine 4-epimerase